MGTQFNTNTTITPETYSAKKPRKTSSLSVQEQITITFRGVPKELRPRFSLSDHVYSREEVAMAPPLLRLPRVLVPKRGKEVPPFLHYGLPISLKNMASLARSREPNVEVITELGFVSSQVRKLAAQCLAEEIGWPVYVEGVLNAPDTPFIMCMVESYTMEERQHSKELPTRDHICRMQKALEVDPKVQPLWYIATGFYAWQYLEVVSA